jgi:hypothetical protein
MLYLTAWFRELLDTQGALHELLANKPTAKESLHSFRNLCIAHPLPAALLVNFARQQPLGDLYFLLRDAEVPLNLDAPFGGDGDLSANSNLLEDEFLEDKIRFWDAKQEAAWEALCQEVSGFLARKS